MEGLDKIIVQACMNRTHYMLCLPYMKDNTLSSDAREVLLEFNKFYREFETMETFTKGEFLTWLGTKTTHNKEVVELIVSNLENSSYEDDYVRNVLRNTATLQCATKLSELVEEFNAGDLEKPMEKFQGIIELTMEKVKKVDAGFVDTSTWTEIFEHEDKEGGLPWFSHGIGELIHSLLKGRFIIVGASTDCGKTTFLINNALHWVQYLEEGEKIAWFNNEESTQSLWMRLAQRILCLSEFELISNFSQMDEKGNFILNSKKRPVLNEELLVTKLNDKLGFNIRDKFVFINAFTMSTFDVEIELKQQNYRVCIFDMLDHISCASTGNGQQADIEYKYNWARRLASIFDMSVIASSQTSVEGNVKRRPALEDLKDSKVCKQTTCDLLIMLGMDREAGDNMPRADAREFVTRYVSTPKNKMRNVRITREEMKYANADLQHAVLALDPARAIFVDGKKEEIQEILFERDTLLFKEELT